MKLSSTFSSRSLRGFFLGAAFVFGAAFVVTLVNVFEDLAVGLAFLYYGRQEEADAIVQQLLAEKVRGLGVLAALRLSN